MKDIFYCPQARALSAALSTFGSGILCSSVVTDITVDGVLTWSKIFSSEIALITLICFILFFIYYIGMYNVDIANDAVLKNYQDKDVLIAMMRKGQMKALIKRSAQQIKKGNYAELHSIDQILKGEYGYDSNSDNGTSQKKDSTVS
ncbi:hypothetical protein [Cytobacillus sp. Bac17]|uniref:hypothetical protein n=1 Tax=Cytobacillus sp. Bac17 TaxID=2926008 RepID=UPI002118725E|nr:hypothetical protein [Cytobacillus sp. Bac17]